MDEFPDPETLTDVINDFSMDLHLAARSERHANQVLSPVSAWIALAMAAEGARGETAAEMKHAMRIDGAEWTAERLHADLRSLLEASFRDPEEGDPSLFAANGVWVDHGIGLEPPFEEALRTWFRTEPKRVDFGSRAAAAARINDWASSATREQIDSIVTEDDLEDVLLVLANAVFFEGRWANGFRESATQPEPFRLDEGGTVDVPMMRQEGPAAYAQGPECEALELRYAGTTRDFGMVILLPPQPDGLATLEERLVGGHLRALLARLHTVTVDVRLPRFELDHLADLVKPLVDLGIRRAFSDTTADFTAIAFLTPLRIRKVLQRAATNVDERGTVAAATTVVTMRDAGISPPRTPHAQFRADRPFLFLIRDRQTGLVLFVGRVTNPGG